MSGHYGAVRAGEQGMKRKLTSYCGIALPPGVLPEGGRVGADISVPTMGSKSVGMDPVI